jgi:hypothetical protein
VYNGAPFSPVTIAENDVAQNGATIETYTFSSGNLSSAIAFYALSATHKITGVRFYWLGGATTVKASVWSYQTAGGCTRLATSTVTVTAHVEYIATFSTAVTMAPGLVYSVAYWDQTSQTGVTNLGNATSANSAFRAMMAAPFQIANNYLVYILPPFNGGGTAIPELLYANGDICPFSVSSTGLGVIEPVTQ